PRAAAGPHARRADDRAREGAPPAPRDDAPARTGGAPLPRWLLGSPLQPRRGAPPGGAGVRTPGVLHPVRPALPLRQAALRLPAAGGGRERDLDVVRPDGDESADDLRRRRSHAPA